MADWYGMARSNYFNVKDREAFESAMEDMDVAVTEGDGENAGKLALLSEDQFGGWPSFIYNPDTDDHEEVDFPALVSGHLAEGEVAILMEVGYEKMCYATGVAVAVNSKGEQRIIRLNDIYEKAKELAPEGASITDCQY